MTQSPRDHALMSLPGVLALSAWTIYILLAVLQLPDVFPSVLIPSAIGFLACLAVVLNFKHWRLALLLASVVYLLFYAVRIARMTMLGADSEKSSLISGIFQYYGASWQLAGALSQESGAIGVFKHVFTEYLMPVLMLALIGSIFLSRRTTGNAALPAKNQPPSVHRVD